MSYQDIKQAALEAGISIDEQFRRMAEESFVAVNRNGNPIFLVGCNRTDWEFFYNSYGIVSLVKLKDFFHRDFETSYWINNEIQSLKIKYPAPISLRDWLSKAIKKEAKDIDNISSRLTKVVLWAADKLDMEVSQLENGEYLPQGYVKECEKCNCAFHTDEEFTSVNHNSYSNYEWCQECVNEYAFLDNDNDCYYNRNNFTEIEINGQTLCREEHEVYYDDDADEWRWEEDRPRDIDDYHDNYRPWNDNGVGKELMFGCELEIESDNRCETAIFAKENGMFAERDGSLDEETGVEIIAPPMKLKEYKTKGNRWEKFLTGLDEKKCRGYDAGTDYGLHVSINRQALTNLHTGKLLVFINHNKDLCESIAERGENEWAQYREKRIAGHMIRDGCSGKLYARDYTDKYEALSIRSQHRIECRIFRSTIKYNDFLRAVEFCAAAVEFTRNASNRELDAINFYRWLEKPGKSKEYPNLTKKLEIKKAA